MPDRTRGLAPEVTLGTVSSGDVVALGMARIVSGGSGRTRDTRLPAMRPLGRVRAMDAQRPSLDVPVLEADGLRLRPWRESDVPRIVEACSDVRTQAWLGRLPHPYTESDALAWLEHQR